MVTGIIMAAGYSRRFGQNKLLLEIEGERLFEKSIAAAATSLLDSFLVITRFDEIIEYCKERGIAVYENRYAHTGQSSSVRLGVQKSLPQTDYMFLVADQPQIDARLINQLLDAGKKQPGKIIVPTTQGEPSSPTLFPAKFKEELLKITGESGGRSVIKSNQESVYNLKIANWQKLEDIDTIEDWQLTNKTDK